MKIRQGFVSNSSTSSFCIFGVSVDNCVEDLEKLFGSLPSPYSEQLEEMKAEAEEEEEELETYDLRELYNEYLKEKYGLEVTSAGYDSDGAYIGIDCDGMDLETFTKKCGPVAEIITELTGKKSKIQMGVIEG
jgi:hypothetical protein